MLRVVGCITQDHDAGMVALACVLCVLATTASARLVIDRNGSDYVHRTVRLTAAILAFSIGVWTTHFISILAYRPAIPLGFDLALSALSLLLAIGFTALAFVLYSRLLRFLGGAAGRIWPAACAQGLLLAAGIGSMHFVGMGALRMSGILHYQPSLVFASLALGTPWAVIAMALLQRRRPVLASASLTLAVASIHFIAMTAITLEPTGRPDVASLFISRSALGIAVAGACLLILVLAVAASSLDRHLGARVAREARRFRTLADATFEGLIFERNGLVIDVNRAMCGLAGSDAATLIGLRLADLIPGVVLQPQPGDRSVEHVVVLPSGQTRPVEALWREDLDTGGHVVALRDLSREKAAESEIERLARFDTLTGLANRDMLEQELQKAVALSGRGETGLAVVDLEIDRFDEISDLLGSEASHEILIETARRLSAAVRETDTVARVGRSEFAIVECLVHRHADVAALADRVSAQMALPFAVGDRPLRLVASVGIALYPEDARTGVDLLRNATLARRHARQEGQGWRYFEPLMDLKLQNRRAMELDLRTALEKEQFCLNYQPFVAIQPARLAGYEALLRWDHPECGRIPPAEFIPLAEECGLIVPIGKWVLVAACAEAASWNESVTIAVNLSPAQFVQPGIVATVADALRRTGLPPERLELEITEGTLMADTQNALRTLTALKALGVQLAMDDFGTGYSSLSYLRKFPFDKLKIDRSFINDVTDNTEAQTIVQAIITLGRNLGLEVTAEGVETKRQLDLLRQQGCTYAQGYLLGRPHPANQIGQHIEQESPVAAQQPASWLTAPLTVPLTVPLA
jgi:diguanylate cyclase (GGDEF)-like protein